MGPQFGVLDTNIEGSSRAMQTLWGRVNHALQCFCYYYYYCWEYYFRGNFHCFLSIFRTERAMAVVADAHVGTTAYLLYIFYNMLGIFVRM